jgi:hypothetical protein
VDVVARDWSRWRKSRHSASAGCVEVRLRSGHIQVRDSKAPHDGMLTFTPDEWRAFVDGAKDGEFDLPG